jgi:hypothetical protein
MALLGESQKNSRGFCILHDQSFSWEGGEYIRERFSTLYKPRTPYFLGKLEGPTS